MTPKTLLTAAAIAAASVAGASEPTTMTVWQNGEKVATEAICNQSELRFGDGISFFPAADKEGMVFELTNNTVITFFGRSGLDATVAEHDAFALRSNPVGFTLEVTGHVEAPTTLDIFAIHGAHVLSVAGWYGQPVDVAALAPGMYILKINNQTIKFIKS